MKPTTHNRLLTTAWLLALACSLTGCIVIPLNTDSGNARSNLERHTPEQFVAGKTTRADVILALGEPDAVSSDERQLAYRSEKIAAVWILAGGDGYAGGATGGSIFKNRFYIFEFGPEGIYQAATQSGHWGLVEGDREPTVKSPTTRLGDAARAAAANPGEAVQREYPKSFWLPGVDGYRGVSPGLMGESGRLFCTDRELIFATESQFANTKPELELPYASVAEVHVAKYVLARRLVVRLKTGEVHSFDIRKPGSAVDGKPAIQALRDFIASKISPSPPTPHVLAP